MMTTRLSAQNCPKCAKLLDAATSMGEKATPSTGDLTVCIWCSTLLQFGEGLQLVPLTQKEFLALPHHVQAKLRQAVFAIRTLHPEAS